MFSLVFPTYDISLRKLAKFFTHFTQLFNFQPSKKARVICEKIRHNFFLRENLLMILHTPSGKELLINSIDVIQECPDYCSKMWWKTHSCLQTSIKPDNFFFFFYYILYVIESLSSLYRYLQHVQSINFLS